MLGGRLQRSWSVVVHGVRRHGWERRWREHVLGAGGLPRRVVLHELYGRRVDAVRGGDVPVVVGRLCMRNVLAWAGLE